MTKLGFVMRGLVDSRPLTKRRKARDSRGSFVARKGMINVIDKNGNVHRRVVVNTRGGRLFLAKTRSCAEKTMPPQILKISAEASAELSFRMLSTLDDRMKEEQFDAFE